MGVSSFEDACLQGAKAYVVPASAAGACCPFYCRNWVLATNTWRAGQHTSGPVLAVVGKGHLPGIEYAVLHLVEWMAKTGGHPVRLTMQEGSQAEG